MPDDSRRFPKSGATEEEVIAYKDVLFSELSTYRDRHLSRITRNLYYEMGRQWIEPDLEVMPEGARGFAFKEMAPDQNIELPQPVDNQIAPAVDVEFATLSKRQWTPKVVTFSRDPRAEASAKVANDILNDRLEKLRWPDIRDRFIRNEIIQGTAILSSRWDESYRQVTTVGSPEAVRCPQCNSLFSSPQDLEGTPLEACPSCGASGFEPFEVNEGLANSGQDYLQRPLGKQLPKGQTAIELITPYEYFPENAGVDKTPFDVRIHGIRKVRSLDWIEEHYPQLEGKVSPEDATDLMRDHPLMGEWDILGRYDPSLDGGIYDSHARVYEMIAEPSYRYPKGRYVVVVGKTQNFVPVDTDLMVSAGGEEVARVMVASAVWKSREGEFWGRGLPDDLISPQNRINGIDAQMIEARERMGSPNLMIPEDAELQGPEYRRGYGAAKLFRYQISALAPAAKPEVFGSILMPRGVVDERNQCLQSMKTIVGPADIEIGEAPRNITTTSGLQILGEQAERRRGTRERDITSAFQKIWEHQLKLLWTLRVDADTYEAKTPDGVWEVKEYTREAIGGQTKISVEKQAYVDRSIIQREATREALVDRLYIIDSPLARKRILELMNLPTDVNEDSNLQIDHAKRDWVDFIDDQKLPVLDPTLDNPMIRFQVFGTMLLQDEGRQAAARAHWPEIVPKLAGWEDELAQIEMLSQQILQFYGGVRDPQQLQVLYAQAMDNYQQQQDAYQQQVALMQVAPPEVLAPPPGAPPGAVPGAAGPGPPPQEPPQPVVIPQALDKKIYLVWRQMLAREPGFLEGLVQSSAAPPGPGEEPLAPVAAEAGIVDSFLKLRAIVDAYRLMAMRQMQPMLPPGPPAPGSGQTMMPQDPGAPMGGPPPQPGQAAGGM